MICIEAVHNVAAGRYTGVGGAERIEHRVVRVSVDMHQRNLLERRPRQRLVEHADNIPAMP